MDTKIANQLLTKLSYIRSPHELYYGGIRLQQSWTTLFVLERIFDENKDITAIVELGTGHGALTAFFGLHMKNRGRVLTWDVDDSQIEWTKLEGLPCQFIKADILDQRAQKWTCEFIANDRSLIFCDAGERDIRSKQFHIYAAILKPHDVIMIHDYKNSIHDSDVKDIKDLQPFYQEMFDDYRTFILSRIKV